MKKRIMLVSTLVVMAMSAMFVACQDKNSPSSSSEKETEKEEIKGCKCTVTIDGESASEKISIDDMEELDVSTCSALEKLMKKEAKEEGFDDFSVTCKSY